MFPLILTVLNRIIMGGYYKQALLRTDSIRGNMPSVWGLGFPARRPNESTPYIYMYVCIYIYIYIHYQNAEA